MQMVLPMASSAGSSRCRERGESAFAPLRVERGLATASVAVALAGARPDKAEGVAGFVVEEVGEDGGVEARIVELEAQIVAALVGALGPGGADFGIMRCTA